MSVLGRRGTLSVRALNQSTSATPACSLRPFSVLNRPPSNYPGHVPLTIVERGALAVGSALGSLVNPRRGGKLYCLYRLYPPLNDLTKRTNNTNKFQTS